MKFTRRALLGTAAACLSAGPASFAYAQDALALAADPAHFALRCRRRERHLGAHPGRVLGQEPGPAVHRREQAWCGHPRLANELVAHAARRRLHLALCRGTVRDRRSAVRQAEVRTRKDLQPVAMVAMAPLFLVVNAQSGFKTAQDLIAHGKTKPAASTFGSPGAGSQPHLAAELLLRDAGVKGVIVHFRGDAPAYAELLAGRVDATLTAITPPCRTSRPASCACSAWPRPAQRDVPGRAAAARPGPAERRGLRLVRLHGAGHHAAARWSTACRPQRPRRWRTRTSSRSC